jgi:Cu2+-exporting ATPase
LILTVPLLTYTDLIQNLLGYTAPPFPGSQYLPFVLGSFIFFYGGSVFLRGALDELRSLRPGMMTLVALAITAAYIYSVAGEFLIDGEPLYWELATLVVIMLLGHWIEMRAVGAARSAVTELAKLLPDFAERIEDGRIREVPLNELRVGDFVLIRPGSRIPADGVVEDGRSSINESMITGESRLLEKEPGSMVIAGTVNADGSLRVRVTNVGEKTMLAGIMRLVEQAQMSRSQAQALADRAAYWLVLIAIGAAAITLTIWLAAGASGNFALERTVTVLVVACPHALGLAIPLVISISTSLAARHGLLVRDRLALEKARDVDIVVFDKTGTLTQGEFGVVHIATAGAIDENEALAVAAAVEGDSEHHLARAISAEAERRRLILPPVTDFQAIPGKGVRARVDRHVVQVGRLQLLEVPDPPRSTSPGRSDWSSGMAEAGPPRRLDGISDNLIGVDRLMRSAQQWSEEGKTVVYLFEDGRLEAVIALADVVRFESRDAVASLQQMGVRVAMLTGDSEEVARWVARDLGIDEWFAEVLPEQKAEKVNDLRQRELRVAMVGDGVNDAPALLSADVGIAIGAGTQVAVESAGIILVKNDPRDVVRVIHLSRASYRKMVENLLWATGYNVFALPIASGVLFPFGIVPAPAIGAIMMSISTVIVAINAQLLRRLNF